MILSSAASGKPGASELCLYHGEAQRVSVVRCRGTLWMLLSKNWNADWRGLSIALKRRLLIGARSMHYSNSDE
jgi:hypothetical protein